MAGTKQWQAAGTHLPERAVEFKVGTFPRCLLCRPLKMLGALLAWMCSASSMSPLLQLSAMAPTTRRAFLLCMTWAAAHLISPSWRSQVGLVASKSQPLRTACLRDALRQLQHGRAQREGWSQPVNHEKTILTLPALHRQVASSH